MRRAGQMAVVLLAVSALPTAPAAVDGDADAPSRRQGRAAVDAALRWLAARQVTLGEDQGYWDSPRYRTATASFAGLAFLANGHRPGKGKYGQVLTRAMRFVQAQMDADGYAGAKDNSMYAHAAAMLFGLSYLGRSDDPKREASLAAWCRKGLALIVRAQQVHKAAVDRGGWRYRPQARDSDVSVTSWQLLVLHAARQCGFRIDDAVFQRAMRYVNSAYMADKDGRAGFVYRPGVSRAPEPAVTGVAVFLKRLLEIQPDEKVAQSLEYLRTFAPAWGGKQYKGYFFFGTFYMVQGMFQVGGGTWEAFAPKIRKVLLAHQSADGHWNLPPDNVPQSRLAGRVYATAMAVLILSVENQYLPMYQRQAKLFGQ